MDTHIAPRPTHLTCTFRTPLELVDGGFTKKSKPEKHIRTCNRQIYKISANRNHILSIRNWFYWNTRPSHRFSVKIASVQRRFSSTWCWDINRHLRIVIHTVNTTHSNNHVTNATSATPSFHLFSRNPPLFIRWSLFCYFLLLSISRSLCLSLSVCLSLFLCLFLCVSIRRPAVSAQVALGVSVRYTRTNNRAKPPPPPTQKRFHKPPNRHRPTPPHKPPTTWQGVMRLNMGARNVCAFLPRLWLWLCVFVCVCMLSRFCYDDLN